MPVFEKRTRIAAPPERVYAFHDQPEALTLRHFLVHTVAHELLHVDGALWRTLRLLFVQPGKFTSFQKMVDVLCRFDLKY